MGKEPPGKSGQQGLSVADWIEDDRNQSVLDAHMKPSNTSNKSHKKDDKRVTQEKEKRQLESI